MDGAPGSSHDFCAWDSQNKCIFILCNHTLQKRVPFVLGEQSVTCFCVVPFAWRSTHVVPIYRSSESFSSLVADWKQLVNQRFWTRRRSVRECSQTERGDDRYVTFLQLPNTTIGSIPRNSRRTSFQIISSKLKYSVNCNANSNFEKFRNFLENNLASKLLFIQVTNSFVF